MSKSQDQKALTPRQVSVIPFLVATPSIEEACRRAKISKPTVYTWMKNDVFKEDLQRQREEFYTESLELLKAGQNKAVKSLIKLIDSPRPEIALRASTQVIASGLKLKELEKSGPMPEDDDDLADITLEVWREIRPKFIKDHEERNEKLLNNKDTGSETE
jgi:hypothetical protein